MIVQQRILEFVRRANWVLLAAATAAGATFASREVALGIFCGGLIVTVNFHLLARTLRGALTPPHLASLSSVIAKYYLRFLASAAVLFLLILSGQVHPLGLVLGVSTVVASIFLATLREVKKILCNCKEAG